MDKLKAAFKALAKFLFLLLAAPVLLLLALAAFSVSDLLQRLFGRPRPPAETRPSTAAVSVVIPTWNGREHLEANLPSVIGALRGNPEHEIIVADNGSADGTVEYLRREFPQVRVLELGENRGFGGGSNAGFEAARHDIVVLLNNDMRVEPDFLVPLLEGFRDPRVFAVSSQIFMADPAKRREETGLTAGEWLNGRLQVRHVADERVQDLFPAFYAGGGSTAYDRRKFLDLGGFDSVLEPFYFEDTDISYMAWKRGWINFYQPRSVVYHAHRGTIGRHFNPFEIEAVLKKNQLLFTWKNIHAWSWLAAHFFWLYAGLWLSFLIAPTPLRPSVRSFVRALRQSGACLRSRWRARSLTRVGDAEAFRRPLGGYFRDRFLAMDEGGEALRVLFVSPYPIEPPLHGGALFMNQTARQLARRCELHLLCLLDEPEDLASNQALDDVCASTEFVVRWKDPGGGLGALLPHAAQEFYSSDFLWRMHRAIYVNRVHAVQVEYTQMAVYAPRFRRIASFLFEHDIYFQSVQRAMKSLRGFQARAEHAYEYLRALRFERKALKRFDAVQVCTAESRRYLESYVWDGPPVLDGLRAGIDVSRYEYAEEGREPDTLLFVGNFQHIPNQQALRFFLEQVWPRLHERRPALRLIVAGSHMQAGFRKQVAGQGVEFLGRVADIRVPLSRYALFVCPILSGSGVRVKLLEAFAAGIPAVSTRLGAEGLLDGGEELLALADSPEEFEKEILALLEDPDRRRLLARNARREAENNWNVETVTERLLDLYLETWRAKYRTSPLAEPLTLHAPREAAALQTNTCAEEASGGAGGLTGSRQRSSAH